MTIAFVGLPLVLGALAAGAHWVELSRMLAAREALWSATMDGGLAILISWMMLLVGGRWRAERSWIDRFARAMGVYWIVTAFTVWAVLFYYECESSGGFEIRSKTSVPLAKAVGLKILDIVTLFMPFVAMVTLALIPIRLIAGWPRFRGLVRESGMVASCAAAVAIVLGGLQTVLKGLAWGEVSPIPGLLLGEEAVLRVSTTAGLAVLVSWTTLFVGGQWRAQPMWADRLGRTIGFLWILAAFAVAIGNALIASNLLGP